MRARRLSLVNVAVGVIFTCKVTVSEVLYCTEFGPVGYSKPMHSIDVSHDTRMQGVGKWIYAACLVL